MRMVVRTITLAVAVSFIILSAGCADVPLADQLKYSGKRQLLYGNTRVGQEFSSSDRHLNRIDVFLFPSKLMSDEESSRENKLAKQRLQEKHVLLHVYDKPGGRRLARVKRPAATITDKGLYVFRFEPLAESKQKQYYFELQAPGLTEESAIAVAVTDVDRYDGGRAYLNGEPLAESDTRFQPYIRMNARMLANSMAGRLWSDRPFVVVWGLIVAATLVAAVRSWREALRADG
jgi:hypothetical protein